MPFWFVMIYFLDHKLANRVHIVDSNEQISGPHHHQPRSNSDVGNILSNHSSDVPPLSDLDSDVLESLPPEIFSEINDLYGGKLKNFISKRKSESIGVSSALPANVKGKLLHTILNKVKVYVFYNKPTKVTLKATFDPFSPSTR